MPDRAYLDDASIEDSAELWRRIPPWHFVADPKREGGFRASSAAFDDDEDGPMSIQLEQILREQGITATAALQSYPCYSLSSFVAGTARHECGQAVVRDPLPHDRSHGLVCGEKTKGIQRKLEKSSRFVVRPLVGLKNHLGTAIEELSGSGGRAEPNDPMPLLLACEKALRQIQTDRSEFRSARELIAASIRHLRHGSVDSALSSAQACLGEINKATPD